MNRLALTFMTGMLFAGTSPAQLLSDDIIPPPPPNGLSDDSGILGKNSVELRRVSQRLQEIQQNHGYRTMLVLKRALISTSASDYASRLQQEWLPDGGGLVIVYESDTQRVGFGRGLSPDEGMENNTGIPAYALETIITNALRKVDSQQAPERVVDDLMREIGSGIDSYFKRKGAAPDNGRSLRLALVTIGALSLLALCGMGIGWLLGQTDKKQSEIRVFPEVNLPERLGASYGGGFCATVFYGSSQNN